MFDRSKNPAVFFPTSPHCLKNEQKSMEREKFSSKDDAASFRYSRLGFSYG